MKKYRIAQVGSFDVENYGDLLFADVFEKQIKKNIEVEEILLFSPNHCKMPFNEKRQVYSVVELEKIYKTIGFDAIVVGGGDLVQMTKFKVNSDHWETEGNIYNELYMWFLPFFVSAKYNIPLIWNALGVPETFYNDEKNLIKNLISKVDYISVRDYLSKDKLSNCGVEGEIHVYPDSVLSVSQFYSKNYLKEILLNFTFENFIDTEYIVFHANAAYSKEDRKKSAEELIKIKNKYNYEIILQPIGYALNDMEAIEEIYSYFPDEFFLFSKKLSPVELLALIAYSKAYIGASLHGCITANSYGVPGIVCNCAQYSKFEGYFQHLNLSSYIVEKPENINEVLEGQLNIDITKKIEKLLPLINEHFYYMAEEIKKENSNKEIMDIALSICEYEYESRNQSATLNNYIQEIYDSKHEFNMLSKETVERYNELTKEKNEMKREYEMLDNEYKKIYGILYEIENSTFWKMTNPARKVLDKSKEVVKGNAATRMLYKGVVSIKNDGFGKTRKKLDDYLARRKKIQKFYNETGIYFSPNDNNQEFCVFDSKYQNNLDFSDRELSVKMLAFYLPQFHRIKENDEWWGEGFTEWSNTTKTSPRFSGHYQPRTPHQDIGYYDLSNVETMKKQVNLARQHGIYGFCFYYYWFSGRRIMEKPIDMLLDHPEIDIKFCLCWANENFTRAWDGLNKEILLGQSYSFEDQTSFIIDLKKYIDDERYIRINGKPLIIVYNPGEIPEINKTFQKWRECAENIGIGEILIWTCQTANNTAESLNIENIIDAEVEFPPHNMWHEILGVRDLDLNGKAANIYNYNKLVKIIEKQYELDKELARKVPLHRTCMMGWDNSARREENWTTFYGYSLKSFYKWASLMVEETENIYTEEERFVFVNAWNEWAEGTYLEPDEKYGYANINTLSKALYKIPFERIKVLNTNSKEHTIITNEKPEIAVQIHLYYTDTIDEIIDELNKIPFLYDCFISTTTNEKKIQIENIFKKKSSANNTIVEVFENRGRDVAPFLKQLKNRITQYKYVCHIHSKKTKTDDYGVMWRKYLYKNLFGSKENITNILNIFETEENIGIVYPEAFPVVAKQAVWGSNEHACKDLAEKLDLNVELGNTPVFPVGNMFWAKTKAVQKIFEYDFDLKDYPEEKGQTNLTLAHQIERIWCYLAQDAGFRHQKIYNGYFEEVDYPNKKRLSIFVHYDKKEIISDEDIRYIKACSEFTQYFVFVTNSNLKREELDKIRPFAQKIIIRENIGYDFGAWRDAFFELDFEKLKNYDELIFINNSCYLVNNNFRYIFNKMEKRNCDFWGMTLSPFLEDGSYINQKCINEHIQSFFQVFKKEVFLNETFIDFLGNIKNEERLVDVIANYETQLTEQLNNAGFKYAVFVEETRLLSKFIGNYSIPYEYPMLLLLLDMPLVKKKSKEYMSLWEKIRVDDFVEQIKR